MVLLQNLQHPTSFKIPVWELSDHLSPTNRLSDWKACREVSKIPICSGVPMVNTPLHVSKVWRNRVQTKTWGGQLLLQQNMKMSRIFSFQIHITWEGPCHPESTLVSEQKLWLSRQSPCLAWLEKGSPAGLFVFLHFSALKTIIFLDISLREEVLTPHVRTHQTKKYGYRIGINTKMTNCAGAQTGVLQANDHFGTWGGWLRVFILKVNDESALRSSAHQKYVFVNRWTGRVGGNNSHTQPARVRGSFPLVVQGNWPWQAPGWELCGTQVWKADPESGHPWGSDQLSRASDMNKGIAHLLHCGCTRGMKLVENTQVTNMCFVFTSYISKAAFMSKLHIAAILQNKNTVQSLKRCWGSFTFVPWKTHEFLIFHYLPKHQALTTFGNRNLQPVQKTKRSHQNSFRARVFNWAQKNP